MSTSDDFRDQEPPKKGMSTTVKVLLVLAGLGGVFVVLCCGGMYFGLGKLQQFAQQATSEDPNVVRTKTSEVVRIEIPDGFEPKQSVDALVMKFVMWQKASNHQGVLEIRGGGSMISGNTKQQQDQALLQLRQQLLPGGVDFNASVQESTTKEFMVCGQPAKFEFRKIAGATDGTGTRQVIGGFVTKAGVALIALSLPEQEYDEAAVIRMIESIKDP